MRYLLPIPAVTLAFAALLSVAGPAASDEAAAVPQPTQSNPYADGALIEGLGIDGRWARNCSGSASEANAYTLYKVRSGSAPTETRTTGAEIAESATLSNVRRAEEGRVAWTRTSDAGAVDIVMQLKGNQMRLWSAVAGDGTTEAAHGKDAQGHATPWLNKCETN